jgi:ABC-type lipoprotein export system ATPase subunit
LNSDDYNDENDEFNNFDSDIKNDKYNYVTEKNIINNLKFKYPEKTLILISHREASRSFCDRIYDLKDFKIIERSR